MTTIVGILVVICVDIINLKNKAAKLFYQEKWVYSGIAENCNSGHASHSKTIGKSGEESRVLLFYKGKRGVGEGLL